MNLIEEIAEALHDGWWRAHLKNGWTLGPRDRDHKMHPHLLPSSACGLENNNTDRAMAALLLNIVIPALQRGERPDRETVATWAHGAWARAAELCGRLGHEHILADWEAHSGIGREEHLEQADTVLAILQRWDLNQLKAWRT